MRLLLTGAGGLLGRAVDAEARLRGHEVTGLARSDMDVTDARAVRAGVEAARPDVIIHCAAYTAVDRAESEPDRAMAVNRDGTRNVAEAAARGASTFVYVSTDYVFDGSARTPYRPDAPTGPLSVYGRTKLEGERAALAAGDAAVVVRTSWLYGDDQGFVPAILRRVSAGQPLRVVDDQRGRPTWVRDLAVSILDLLAHDARGVWHVAGGGDCTWAELAREAIRMAELEAHVEPISTADFGAPAPRPVYSVLDVADTEALLGRPMTDWREALGAYLKESPWGSEGPST